MELKTIFKLVIVYHVAMHVQTCFVFTFFIRPKLMAVFHYQMNWISFNIFVY